MCLLVSDSSLAYVCNKYIYEPRTISSYTQEVLIFGRRVGVDGADTSADHKIVTRLAVQSLSCDARLGSRNQFDLLFFIVKPPNAT